jgi:release factor glutamine methyltransferase
MAIDHADQRTVIRRLMAAGCIAADEEAAVLLGAAPHGDVLETWIRRRERGEPLAWIVGTTTFCGRTVRVDPHVYVPRWRSEALARRAAALLPREGGRAVDLCTGAGAIAVHLASEAPDTTVIGTDIDANAIRCARRNGVLAVRADLGTALRGQAFDVVTVVAPYVPAGEVAFLPADIRHYEPGVALDGGEDGLDVVRRASETAARLLKPGGWFLAEVGGNQAETMERTLATLGFCAIEPWFDDDGDLRGITAQLTRTPGGT